MIPRTHFIVSLIISVIYFPFFGWWSFLAIVGGFLIDVDHYLEFIIRFKRKDLFNAFFDAVNFYENGEDCGRYKDILHIFHTFEFWVLYIILGLIFPFLLPFVFSIFVHLGMDFYGMWKDSRNLFQRTIFLSSWILFKTGMTKKRYNLN